MKIEKISIRNFRRLEDVNIGIEERETVFVGPNNSGKTSATAIFRCFLGARNFRIHDFSVSKISGINAFGNGGDENELPAIELDIWFRIDPESIEFGRAFALLPNLSGDFERVGIRLSFKATNPSKMREDYHSDYSSENLRSLSEFLTQDNKLREHFKITYASLEIIEEEVDGTLRKKINFTPLDPEEGKKLLTGLVRIDFVDAQRNINDDEESRSNRLSNAFASFYRSNLEQAVVAQEAHKLIDENNQKLTDHYQRQFGDLMNIIKGLGVPSINDRELRLVSSLSPEAALRGSTDLFYVDADREHELPEAYNGLGFKNLIYMAIQARHYHSQWARTKQNRPLCQIIFIEEPEVHLHAQVQQAFIKNIWKVLDASARAEEEAEVTPQLIITTHSSHILDAVEFAKVRYFRRCQSIGKTQGKAKILNASQIHSLRDFHPGNNEVDSKLINEADTLAFLQRYLRLTHCDLFFADAAILVEGAAEKLLMPVIIDKATPELRHSYLTVLEVGGAYAHLFDDLLSFLSIPYLIITDIDSVSAEGKHPACRADEPGALTSNQTLKKLLAVKTIEDLISLKAEQKINQEKNRFISFQQDIPVQENKNKKAMRPRTFEEAFAYQNFGQLRSGKISIGIEIPSVLNDAYEDIYQRINKSDKFKKTDFAMHVLSISSEWLVPDYIVEGLKWLENKLHPTIVDTDGV